MSEIETYMGMKDMNKITFNRSHLIEISPMTKDKAFKQTWKFFMEYPLPITFIIFGIVTLVLSLFVPNATKLTLFSVGSFSMFFMFFMFLFISTMHDKVDFYKVRRDINEDLEKANMQLSSADITKIMKHIIAPKNPLSFATNTSKDIFWISADKENPELITVEKLKVVGNY